MSIDTWSNPKPTETVDIFEVRISDLKLHKLVEDNPVMTDIQFQELKEDVETNGQLEPIDVYKKKFIVDGRHRTMALNALGKDTVKVKHLPYNISIEDVRALVKSRETRRHQSPTQKAIKAWRKMKELNINQRKAAEIYGVSRNSITAVSRISEMLGTDVVNELYKGVGISLDGRMNLTSLTQIVSIAKEMKEREVDNDLRPERLSDEVINSQTTIIVDMLKDRDKDVLISVARKLYAMAKEM